MIQIIRYKSKGQRQYRYFSLFVHNFEPNVIQEKMKRKSSKIIIYLENLASSSQEYLGIKAFFICFATQPSCHIFPDLRKSVTARDQNQQGVRLMSYIKGSKL